MRGASEQRVFFSGIGLISATGLQGLVTVTVSLTFF
jgi:hypothetical protein